MKKLLIISIALIGLSCSGQEKNCDNFRTGEYTYTDPEMSAYTIKRSDSIQIEINNETGIEIYTLVKWISDCEYELTYSKILNVDQDVSHIIGQKINVEIIEIVGNTYKARAKSDAMDSTIEFEKRR